MSFKRTTRALLAVALLGVGVSVAAPAGTPTAGAPAACTLCAGGEFHPLNPERIFDNRAPGINSPVGPKATSPGGSEFTVQLLDEGGIPGDASDVLAVVVNVTVADASRQGSLAIFPTGLADGGAGTSSLVNYLPNRNTPNVAIVGVGNGGTATVRLTTPSGAGTANVAIDVFGWISTSNNDDDGARLITAGPGRIYDSRESGGVLGPDRSRAVQVLGADAPGQPDIVPDRASITGVMINLTAINREPGSANTNLAVTPNPLPAGTPASTSNTNVVPGLVKANLVFAPIGPDGQIHIKNRNGNIHFAVDVLGYLETGKSVDSREGRIIPLDAPFRAFDTRQPEFENIPLGFGSAEDWSFEAFANSVTMPSGGSNIPVGNQLALIGNVTGTGLERLFPTVPVSTFISAYPGGTARSETSIINVPEGENVPNMTLLRYGTVDNDPYVVQMYNHNGSIHYLLDVYAVVLAD
ncbi:MAG: hypothetical protein AAGF73_16030 [Actinomycetota bacterium]